MIVKKITSVTNLIDPFTKTLFTRVFYSYKNSISVKCIPSML